jgi:hypothetical protein
MTLAVCCTSHSLLVEVTYPGPELTADAESAFAAPREFVPDHDPELVIEFAPDHCNGFCNELMPPFCVGLEGTSIGDERIRDRAARRAPRLATSVWPRPSGDRFLQKGPMT